MTESPTFERRDLDTQALAATVQDALAQLSAVQERLQTVFQTLNGAGAAAPPTEAPAETSAVPAEPEALPRPEVTESGAVDKVAWEVAPEDLEIPITHPSHFQPGQTIAIGDGPTREIARIRTIMGTRLLCVRGIEDTAAQHHDRGRNIYIVH